MLRSMLTLLTGGALLATAAGSDWPQFLGPTRDGQCGETKLNWDWPPGGPPVAWTQELGSGWAGPVVAGGQVLVFHRLGDDEVLASLDAATGRQKWAVKAPTRYRDDFNFDDGPRATPLVSGDRVFTLGADGRFSARDRATGQELWARNLLTDFRAGKGFFGVACSPVLIDGKLLVNVGGKGAGVVALDPASGRELWKATDDAASYSSPTVAPIDGKPAAVFLTRFGLRVFDPAGGKVLYELPWRPRVNESVQAATPLVWNDEVFLSVSYSTGAVLAKLKDGEVGELWSNDTSLSSQYNTPVRVGDYLYGVHGRADVGTAKLRCVEWKTGRVMWSRDNFGVAWLLAVDGGLLALTEGGDLVRFQASPRGYTEQGRASILTRPVRAAPALADGRLFARDGRKLVCVNLRRD